MKIDKAIRRHLLKLPMASDSRIAALVDCEPENVRQVRSNMLAAGEIKRVEVDDALANDI